MNNFQILLEILAKDKTGKDIKSTIDNIKKVSSEIKYLKEIASGVKIDPKISVESAKKQIKDLESQLKGLKKTIDEEFTQKLPAALDKISSVSQVASIAMGAIGGAGLLVGNSLVDAAAKAEMLNVALRTVFHGNQAEADAMMAKLKQFANDTQFTTNEVIEVGIKLKALRIETEKIPEALTDIGNLASAFGKDLNTAFFAYQKAMIGDMQTLKEVFGITAEVLNDQVGGALLDNNGKIKNQKLVIEALTQYIRGEFSTGMKDASQTLQGLTSTMEGEWETLKEEFGNEILPLMKDLTKTSIETIQTIRQIDPETKKLIVTAGGLATGLFLAGSAMSGLVFITTSAASNIINITSAIKNSTLAMNVITTSMNTAKIAAIGLGNGISAAALSTGGLVVIAGIAAIAIAELALATLDLVEANAKLKEKDIQQDLKNIADATKEAAKYFPEATNGANAFNAVMKEGVENLKQDEEGLKKIAAALDLITAEELNIKNTRAESNKELQALEEELSKALEGRKVMQADADGQVRETVVINEELVASLQRQVNEQKKTIAGYDTSISKLKNMREELYQIENKVKGFVSSLEGFGVEFKIEISDEALKELIETYDEAAKAGYEFADQQIKALTELDDRYKLSAEQKKLVDAELSKLIAQNWQDYKKVQDIALEEGRINYREYINNLITYIREHGEAFATNEDARLKAVSETNKQILDLEEKTKNARLQIQADMAKGTESLQDDADAEFAARIDNIKKQAEEYRQLEFTIEEIAKWETSVTKQAQEEITNKYSEEAQKRRGIIKETADYEVEIQYESVEKQKRGRDALIEYKSLQGENTENLEEQLRILEEQEKSLRSEAMEYMKCVEAGEQLGDAALGVLETYNSTLSGIEEINKKLQEKNKLLADEQEQLNRNYQLYLQIQVLSKEITQEQADKMYAEFLKSQNEELQKQVDLIMQKIELQGIGSLTDDEQKTLEYYIQQKGELTEIKVKTGEIKDDTASITQNTKEANDATKEYNETLTTTQKTMADINKEAKTMADINKQAVEGRKSVMGGDFGGGEGDGDAGGGGATAGKGSSSSGGGMKSLWDTVKIENTGFSNAGSFGFDNPAHDRKAKIAGEKYAGAIITKSTEDMVKNFLSGMVSRVEQINNSVSNTINNNASTSSSKQQFFDNRRYSTSLVVDNKSKDVPPLLRNKLHEINSFNAKYLAG